MKKVGLAGEIRVVIFIFFEKKVILPVPSWFFAFAKKMGGFLRREVKKSKSGGGGVKKSIVLNEIKYQRF